MSDEELKMCGSNFCVVSGSRSGNLERPPDSEIYEISIIYLACIVIAVSIIAFLLDPLSRYSEHFFFFLTYIDKELYFNLQDRFTKWIFIC